MFIEVVYKNHKRVTFLDSESKIQVTKACYSIEKKDFEWIE